MLESRRPSLDIERQPPKPNPPDLMKQVMKEQAEDKAQIA
jgi:hypothetical protein